MNELKIVLIDVDGIMCGPKTYDHTGSAIYKQFDDRDFTAIKAFKALGIPVAFVTGDPFNLNMAKKRKVDCFVSRGDDGRIDKLKSLDEIVERYGSDILDGICYIGDDIFDIPLLEKAKWSFCPVNAPDIVQSACTVFLKGTGGSGLICEMLDWLVLYKILSYPPIEKIVELDAIEYRK